MDAQAVAPDSTAFEKPTDAPVQDDAPEKIELDKKVAEEDAAAPPAVDVDEIPESKKALGPEDNEYKKPGDGPQTVADTPVESSEKDDKKDDKKPQRTQNSRYSRSSNKFQPNLPESSDPDEIRKQVEFYLSPENLVTDRFMFTQVGGTQNKPVPIKIIADFKRMKHFKPYSAIVAALKESEVLEVINDTEVKRKEPLPEIFGTEFEHEGKAYQHVQDKALNRSIYAKGFGEEEANTQIEIEQFFEPYGPVKSVRLRRAGGKGEFKGSVFVEFDTEATQNAFLALDPKPKYKEKELDIKSKKEYTDTKVKEMLADGRLKPGEAFAKKQYKNSSSSRGGYRNGNRDDNRSANSGRGRGRGGRDGRGGRGRGNDHRGGGDRNGRGRRDRDDDGENDKKDWRERREQDQKADAEAAQGTKRARDDGDAKADAPEAKKPKEDTAES